MKKQSKDSQISITCRKCKRTYQHVVQFFYGEPYGNLSDSFCPYCGTLNTLVRDKDGNITQET